MFMHCYSLPELDLSHFNVLNVSGMDHLCYDCKSLKKLNLSGWGNNKCRYSEDEYRMFYHCESLRELNLTGWKPFDPTYSDKFEGRYYSITITWSKTLEGYWYYDHQKEKWCYDEYTVKKRRTRKK
jgi:surface protein